MTTSLPKPHKPQTIRQAKAEYKKAGAGTVRLSATEKRRLERQVELDRRAQRIQYRERQRKLQQKRKHEHEQQERQARAILSETAGIGLATQLAGFNHTQVQMKRGMEAFLGIKKERKKEKKEIEKEGEERDAVTADVEDGDCNNDEGRTDDDDDEDISMTEMSCMAMLEDELSMAASSDEEGEGEDETGGKEEEIGRRENKGDPWDIDDLDDGTICTLIASAESSRERNSDSGKPGRLPPMTNSSFNISFSISDIDEAMFSARDDAERCDGGVSSAADRKSGAETSEPPVDLLHKGMLELGDEFVASNSQILRELT